MKYRRKPIVVEAFRLGHDVEPEWFDEAVAGRTVQIHGPTTGVFIAYIRTMEGNLTAARGDWIVQDTAGEIYPVKAELFPERYEAAE